MQQIHLSSLPSGTLTLGAGQLAIVPMTFLPIYPHDDNELPTTSPVEKEDLAPPLSNYQRADLANLVGKENLRNSESRMLIRRNNLEYEQDHRNLEYEVHTKIVVQTSRGTVTLPFTASSVRRTPYEIPERIVFYPPTSGLQQPNTGQPQRSNTPPLPNDQPNNTVMVLDAVNRGLDDGKRTNNPLSDCYDVHMTNPHEDKAIRIADVMVSKPDLINLYVANIDPRFEKVRLTVSEWNGEVWLEPGASKKYIVSVCPVRESMALLHTVDQHSKTTDSSHSIDVTLGYLKIQTESETLFSLLERHVPKQADLSNRVVDRVPRGPVSEAPSASPERPLLSVQPKTKSSLLQALPSKTKIHVVPYVTPQLVYKFTIRNPTPRPIKIMRVMLGLDRTSRQTMRGIGLKVGIDIPQKHRCKVPTGGDTDPECLSSGVVGADSTMYDAFELSCTIDSDRASEVLAQESRRMRFSGTVVVRATRDLDVSFRDWKELMKRNPYREQELVVEVPFVIHVVNHDIHAVLESTNSRGASFLRHEDKVAGIKSVRALFFPFRYFAPRPWKKWDGVLGRTFDYGEERVVYNLNVVSTSPFPLNITKVEIIDQQDEPVSLCNRFVVMKKEPETRKSKGRGGLHELGTITIVYEYNFDSYVPQDVDLGESRYCKLAYSTTPVDTGRHEILLDVFSGTTHVSSAEDLREDEKVDHDSRDLFHGYHDVAMWLREHGAGAALSTYLFRHYRRYMPKSEVLSAYFAALGNEANFDDKLVEPILLKAGAIRHGETKQVPLHLTNLNPVPVQVFVDVSEVEGMSIAMARDRTRGKGDGNAIADFFPQSEKPSLDSRVKEGPWKSHSKRALLHFLQTSNIASALLTFIPYREATRFSKVAAREKPHLRKLYNERAKLMFHSDPVPLHFFRDLPSDCPQSTKTFPHLYKKLVLDDPEGFVDESSPPGPLLLSDDMRIAHPIHGCEPNIDLDSSDKSMLYFRHAPVTIPPGGVARFDVKVLAPKGENLDKDITSFISSGLVLSTDHGEVLPILVAFETLLGELKVSSKAKNATKGDDHEEGSNVELVEIRPRLFQQHASEDGTQGVQEAKPRKDIPLYVKSTFSREVSLRNVESCNPWFKVNLSNRNLETGSPSKIGTVASEVLCPSISEILESYPEVSFPNMEPLFYSFYQCAIRWLKDRAVLQPPGCGLDSVDRGDKELSMRAEDRAVSRAVKALTNAISFSVFKYGQMERRPPGTENQRDVERCENGPYEGRHLRFHEGPVRLGTSRGSEELDWLSVNIFSEVHDAWKAISDLGLHRISSRLRATVDYSLPSNVTDGRPQDGGSSDHDDSSSSPRQSLSVSMQELAVTSSLDMPKLFHPKDRKVSDDEKPRESIVDGVSYLNFPPVLVGNVAALWVPLRNPTGVPVKVKLSVLTEPALRVTDHYEPDVIASEEVREKFIHSFGRVYAQKIGKDDIQTWWDGPGAFMLPDDHGNLLQSLYNSTLPVSRARIGLVNPSLHARNAFSTGCGRRCGVRDSTDKAHVRNVSPIGASAAAGISLIGRQRPASTYSSVEDDEPLLMAGGSSSEQQSPAAFAVPYSSFDELVLPPYGEGSVGPIFFRPPGRHSVLGCDTVIDMENLPWGLKGSQACASPDFEASVFIENSLTGVERLVLRGQGMWERVGFLDATTNDAPDEYGDVEYRFGRPALLFSGTGVVEKTGWFRRIVHPVLKAVTIVNEGDTVIEFRTAYFTDPHHLPGIPRAHNNSRGISARNETDGCEYRGFSMLGCKDNEDTLIEGAQGLFYNNFKYGFQLKPGDSEVIYVEHTPDCTSQTEFVTLNFEFFDEPESTAHREQAAETTSGNARRIKANEWVQLFRPQPVELLIGFEMTAEELAECQPVADVDSRHGVFVSGLHNTTFWNRGVGTSEVEDDLWLPAELVSEIKYAIGFKFDWRPVIVRRSISLALLILLVLLAMRSSPLGAARLKASKTFLARLPLVRAKNDAKQPKSRELGPIPSWASTFRCLGRVDPTSLELQSIGKEQIKQVFLSRLKGPLYIDPAGLLGRDRRGSVVGARARSAKVGNLAQPEKLKTLSETIFHRSDTASSRLSAVPLGLAWRAAAARGIKARTGRESLLSLKSTALKTRRIAEMAKARTLEEELGGDSKHTPQFVKSIGVVETPTMLASQEERKAIGSRDQAVDAVSTSDSEPGQPKDEDDVLTAVEKHPLDKTNDPGDTTASDKARTTPTTTVSSVTDDETPKKEVPKPVVEATPPSRERIATEEPVVTVTLAKPEPKDAVVENKSKTSTKASKKATVDKKSSVSSSSPAGLAQRKPRQREGRSAKSKKGAKKSDDASSTDSSSIHQPRPTKAKASQVVPNSEEKPKHDSKSNRKRGRKNRQEKPHLESPSPSSHRSVSSLVSGSSRSTLEPKLSSPQQEERSLATPSAESLTIRPPPGLAPPPGFGAFGRPISDASSNSPLLQPSDLISAPPDALSAGLSSLSPFDDTSEAALKLLSSPVTPSNNNTQSGPASSSLFHTIRKTQENQLGSLSHGSLTDLAVEGEGLLSLVDKNSGLDMKGNDSERLLSLVDPPRIDPMAAGGEEEDSGSALLGLGGGFNVMDFLDNILDETQHSAEVQERDDSDHQSETSGEALSPTPVLAITTDPWALPNTDVNQSSRAAAYGIAVEEDDGIGGASSSIVQAFLASPDRRSDGLDAVPLWTPEAVMQVGSAFGQEDESDEDDVYHSGSSFFSNIGNSSGGADDKEG